MKLVRILFAVLLAATFTSTLTFSSAAASVNCSNFSTHEEAQAYFEQHGGSSSNNVEGLDTDGDGVICESIPAAKNDNVAAVAQSSSNKLTTQEQTFMKAVASESSDIGDATSDMSDLFTKLGNDPTLIVDQSWTIKVAGVFVKFQNINDEARALKPSPRQQHLYVAWTEVTGLIVAATDDYTRGIDNVDVDSIYAGTAKITHATELSNQLTKDTLAFNKNPDVVANQAMAINGPVTDCSAFADYNVAQVYLALNPAESVTIDPNVDGRACEIFFERDVAA